MSQKVNCQAVGCAVTNKVTWATPWCPRHLQILRLALGSTSAGEVPHENNERTGRDPTRLRLIKNWQAVIAQRDVHVGKQMELSWSGSASEQEQKQLDALNQGSRSSRKKNADLNDR